MDTIISYLPASEGWLPKWLLLISVISMGNSIQAYVSLSPTQKVYLGPTGDYRKSPSTPLQARTFGTWTTLTSIVRMYAAYNIADKPMYELAQWTYLIAFGHFYSEWLWYGTARWGKGLSGPAVISVVTLVWMYLQKDFYVK